MTTGRFPLIQWISHRTRKIHLIPFPFRQQISKKKFTKSRHNIIENLFPNISTWKTKTVVTQEKRTITKTKKKVDCLLARLTLNYSAWHYFGGAQSSAIVFHPKNSLLTSDIVRNIYPHNKYQRRGANEETIIALQNACPYILALFILILNGFVFELWSVIFY